MSKNLNEMKKELKQLQDSISNVTKVLNLAIDNLKVEIEKKEPKNKIKQVYRNHLM